MGKICICVLPCYRERHKRPIMFWFSALISSIGGETLADLFFGALGLHFAINVYNTASTNHSLCLWTCMHVHRMG